MPPVGTLFCYLIKPYAQGASRGKRFQPRLGWNARWIKPDPKARHANSRAYKQSGTVKEGRVTDQTRSIAIARFFSSS
jgi:hypothetical protein